VTKKLIINCDDLGLHPSINRGIGDILARTAISSCSIMPPAPFFEDAKDILLGLGQRMVGVHLTLGAEYKALPMRPLTGRGQVPSLIDESGTFYPDTQRLLPKGVMSHVALELEAQIQKVIDCGLTPSHIDGHMFFYEDSEGGGEYYQLVQKLANKFNLPFRSVERKQYVDRTHFVWDECSDGDSRIRYYEQLFSSLEDGISELLIHPGDDEGLMSQFSSVAYRRKSDYDFFSDSDRLVGLLSEHNIELISWSDIKTSFSL
jgi:predicted glycoside hydrolase/deacetylase ChbG (UPF0249 family)